VPSEDYDFSSSQPVSDFKVYKSNANLARNIPSKAKETKTRQKNLASIKSINHPSLFSGYQQTEREGKKLPDIRYN